VRHAPPKPLLKPPPPAVLVHGLGGASTNWTMLMRELHGDLDLWAPDLPGFGDSPPSGEHTVRAYVADVVSYLETFNQPVHLVGNSMGGLICVLVASSRPDLVRSLTLLSPSMPQYRLPWAAQVTALMAMPKLGEIILGKVNGNPTEEKIQRIAPMLYAEPEALDPDEFAFAVSERLRWIQQPHSNDILLSALRSLVLQYLSPQRRSAWWAARKVLCPMMVLISDKDALVGAWAAKRWRRTAPRARIVTVERCGHVAMMEYPQTVADLLRGFLDDVSDRQDAPSNNWTPSAGMTGSMSPLR
jgi:pimeloyl-ACP methyl ester carboxylesterase